MLTKNLKYYTVNFKLIYLIDNVMPLFTRSSTLSLQVIYDLSVFYFSFKVFWKGYSPMFWWAQQNMGQTTTWMQT